MCMLQFECVCSRCACLNKCAHVSTETQSTWGSVSYNNMYSICMYVMWLHVCVFVACHSGTPQAVRLSSSSLSKKQAAPSGQPTPTLSSLETQCVWVSVVCVWVCLAFTITCPNVNTHTRTNACTFTGLRNVPQLPFHLSLVHTHTLAQIHSSLTGTMKLISILLTFHSSFLAWCWHDRRKTSEVN